LSEDTGYTPEGTALPINGIPMKPLSQAHHVGVCFLIALATFDLHADGPVLLGRVGESGLNLWNDDVHRPALERLV